MTGTSYFQLLNPMIMAIFAGGFLAIWRVDRSQRPALLICIAYAFGSAGFLLDFFLRDPLGPYWGSYVSNVPFLVCVSLTACTMHARCNRPLPVGWVTSISLATLAVMTFFLFIMPSMTARALTMNFGTGALFLVGAFAFRERRLGTVDRILAVAVILSCAQSVARPVVVLWYNGLSDIGLSYADSVYALALHFASAIVALTIASTLLFALGTELVGRLEAAGSTDPLTGLLNRRGLETRASEVREAVAGGGSACVVVADIDHFKSVNDRFGHAAGDEIIQAFATLLQAATRDRDLVARTGGEEFVVVLPSLDRVGAQLFAEGVRSAFAAQPRDVLGGEHVTISLGVAGWRAGEGLHATIEAADEALYAAKRDGRDRVVLAGRAPTRPLRAAAPSAPVEVARPRQVA